MDHFDIVVVGAGLAGALTALSLAATGRSIALVAPEAGPEDGRTTAVMDPAFGLLRTLGLAEALEEAGAPLSSMRIIDGTDRLLRAPVVTFRASEIGLPAFGTNIPNTAFNRVLKERIAATPSVTRITTALSCLHLTDEKAVLHLSDGQLLSADLVAGADGKRSKVRKAAGVEAREWSYPQTALVMNFAHEQPHMTVSTEFHTADGPFTQVPLPGDRSSLVWVMKPLDAARIAALPLTELSLAVERRMQSMLGKVTVEAAPQSFPLSGLTAQRLGAGRAVFIGEAAHAFPPIGAQGLNLSLRDVTALSELVAQTSQLGAEFGARYDARRRADVVSRTVSVDLLNRSLLTGLLPVQLLRAGGLQALASAPPLRNLLMREGLRPGAALEEIGRTLRDALPRFSRRA